MSLTKAICHETLMAAGTRLNRQLTRRLGPGKETELSRQVLDLLSWDLF